MLDTDSPAWFSLRTDSALQDGKGTEKVSGDGKGVRTEKVSGTIVLDLGPSTPAKGGLKAQGKTGTFYLFRR
jgi:hypothetical protein